MSNIYGNFEPIVPVEPMAPWFGGKKYLAARIIERIEAIPHRCYAEPFLGMGGVFLRRKLRPRCEAINDANAEIVNLFRVLRGHPEEFERCWGMRLAARSEFELMLRTDPTTLTDVERAIRLVYIQSLAFSGLPHGQSPGNYRTSTTGATFNVERVRRRIGAVHRRLQGVQIEHLGWADFIRRYDRPWTLFYLDPPYWGHETDYGRGLFAQDDFGHMGEVLNAIRGRFILSINDRPEIRGIFAGFQICEVSTRYSANLKSTRRATELLISGSGNTI